MYRTAHILWHKRTGGPIGKKSPRRAIEMFKSAYRAPRPNRNQHRRDTALVHTATASEHVEVDNSRIGYDDVLTMLFALKVHHAASEEAVVVRIDSLRLAPMGLVWKGDDYMGHGMYCCATAAKWRAMYTELCGHNTMYSGQSS